jgi:DNA-directed RNA polymerase subunit RPC12/RpoP
MQQYRCPNCGAEIGFKTRFCSNCGKQLSWMEQPAATPQYQCPVCNAAVIPNLKHCTNCGTPLAWQGQTQPPPAPPKPAATKTTIREDNSGNKVLKGIGIAVLSLLLFLSLSALGPAFMVDRTMLNPNFVASEVDKLEIASIVTEVADVSLPEDLPVEIKDAVSSTVVKLEPELKQKFNAGIYSIYDYVKGKNDSPGLLRLLRNTVLSNDFLFSAIDDLDTTSLIKPYALQMLSAYIPSELEQISANLDSLIDDFLAQHESWIKEQLKTVAVPVADYLVGDIKTFNVDISLEPIISDLKQTITQQISQLQIPVISLLPSEMIQGFLDEALDKYIPSNFEFRNTMIGAQVPYQIANTVEDIENTLGMVKTYVGYFQIAYILLIIFTLLLIAGIVLIYRRVRGATRTLGIVSLVAGAIDLVFLLLVKGLVTDQLSQSITGLPASLQTWTVHLVNDMTSPMQILSICFIVVGVALIVVSLVYRPRESI